MGDLSGSEVTDYWIKDVGVPRTETMDAAILSSHLLGVSVTFYILPSSVEVTLMSILRVVFWGPLL